MGLVVMLHGRCIVVKVQGEGGDRFWSSRRRYRRCHRRRGALPRSPPATMAMAIEGGDQRRQLLATIFSRHATVVCILLDC